MDHNSSSIWSCASGIGTLLLGHIPTEFGYIWSYHNNLEQLQREVQRLKDTQVALQRRVVEAKNNGDEIEDLVLNWQKEANSTFDEADKSIKIEEARWCLGKCPNLWTRYWMSKKFEEMKNKISQIIQDGNFERISYCKIDYRQSYYNSLEMLKTEVQRLEGIEVSMQHRIAESEKNGEKIEVIVQNWQKEANDTIAYAKKLIDDAAREEEYFNTKRFEEMTKQISQVIENGKIDRISYCVATDVTSSPSKRGYELLESRTSVLNQIKKALKDPKMYMIGVYGMGGVGKTTLVNELAWQVKKEEFFGVVAIADITESPDVKKIQGQIADALDLKFKKESEKGRAGELCQAISQISQKKNVLIILDDIWSELNLVEVGIPFDDEHTGCKLVMTSRNLNLLQGIGTQEEFDLKALLEDDSWILFKKMAGDVVEEVGIKPVAKKLVECCAGLPLLIIVVAKGLRKKDVIIWRDALIQLERLDHEELNKKVYSTLEMSYNWLENKHLKSLFLFIGSFKLNGIDIEEMLLCCWGLGFYGQIHTLAEARDRHYKLINDLRASSLLLEADSKPEWIRMHDVVRGMAKLIASRLHPTHAVQKKTKLEEWPSVDFLQTCHYIIVPSSYIDHDLLKKLECPKLKLLLLQNADDYNLEVPTDFFFGMRELRVLILQGMVLHTLLSSSSLNVLTNLRSLSLCRCILEDISMIVKLTNLEIFILKDSNIKEPIPTHSFAKLKVIRVQGIYGSKNLLLNSLVRNLPRLHEMEIYNCKEIINIIAMEKQEDEKELPKVQFPNLETLYIRYMDGLKSICPKQVAPNSFGKLRKLDIDNCTSLEYVFPISVAKELRQLQELYIYECGIKNIFEERASCDTTTQVYLEKLTISHCHALKTIVPSSVIFQSLDELSVFDCDELVNITSMTTGLPNLRILSTYNCKRLEEIYGSRNDGDGLPGEIAFKKLEKLVLNNLESLTSFCKESYDFKFPSLKIVELNYCPKMETFSPRNLTTSNHTTEQVTCDQTHYSGEEVQFPNLETLDIMHMDGLKSIWSKIWSKHLAPNSFGKLRKLDIYNCTNLEYVFPISVAKELRQLQELYICKCAIKNIFEESSSCDTTTQVYLEKLRISQCDALKTIFPSSVISESLDELSVSSCDELVNITSMTTGLPNLRILSTENCPRLEEIYGSRNEGDGLPGEIALNKLEKLELNYLKSLTSFCKGSYHLIFPSLKIVQLNYCPKMETFSPRNLTTSNLTTVQVTWDRTHSGDLNTTIGTILTEEVEFPNLETLNMDGMHGLKSTWSKQLAPNSFDKLRNLNIDYCTSLEYVFPISVAKELRQLQDLTIKFCAIKNIFEESGGWDTTTQVYLQKLTISNCHALKTVVPSSVIFQSLDELSVSGCSRLVNITAMTTGLPNLRVLSTEQCPRLEEIYGSRNEGDGLPGEIAFKKLEKLELNYLESLTSFCNESYDFKFPSLKIVQLKNCPKMETFSPRNLTTSNLTTVQVTWDQTHYSGHLSTSVGTILTEEVQFPNLETLDIRDMDGLKSICSKQLAPNSFGKLRKLDIYNCTNLEYVIPISVAKELRQLQELYIYECGIKNIFEESASCDTATQVYLEKLTIKYCHGLKTIVPSSVIFQSLDELSVSRCDELVNIITPSMTTCLPNLRILSTKRCPMLEEIYGSRNEGDGLPGEIAFKKLEKLELDNLESLTSFCKESYDFKFPSLKIVILSCCPKMENFNPGNLTTPSLTKKQVTWEQTHYYPTGGEYYEFDTSKTVDYWYDDLNTIETILTEESDKYPPIIDDRD